MLSGLDHRDNSGYHRRNERLMKPLAIDLFCGLGGWSEGCLAAGYDVVGFDIERHQYGTERYPGQLVIQDVLTIHGSQFRNAALIVASPPCQNYSYMAMPWKRAKQIAAGLRYKDHFPTDYTGPRSVTALNELFNACFRIQREACEAAGRYIPMVVENVKGAQPWVGKAKAHFGSFYLWGDVESVGGRIVAAGQVRFGAPDLIRQTARKVPGFNFHEHEKTGQPGRSFQSVAVEAQKQPVWFNDDKRRTGDKCGGDWFASGADCSLQRKASSGSSARKAASAQIAKIPLPLSTYIAASFKPNNQELPLHELYQNEGPGVRDTR